MKKLKIIHLVGARPQFIKAAAFSRALRQIDHCEIEEILVHSGQHYDPDMSGVFFSELEIPQPRYYLGIGSGNHADQTAKVITGFSEILEKEEAHAVVLYGDTNTTLGGAIAASKLHVPIAHVEAGLRSNNFAMPEEINRILTDAVSSFLFCPNEEAIDNLESEGRIEGTGKSPANPLIENVGDLMYDIFQYYSEKVQDLPEKVKGMSDFILLTLHRDFNTDNPIRLENILKGIIRLAEHHTVVFPVHPRTISRIPASLQAELLKAGCIFLEPVGYLHMLSLEKHAKLIITDSGGVQKEAFFAKKPVVIPRPETEWNEIVSAGCAICVDDQEELLVQTVLQFIQTPPTEYPKLFGDGNAANRMVQCLIESL